MLAVDDEPDYGPLIELVGEELGYTVTFATSAEEFIELFDRISPTVVLLDIVMPDTDGIELIRWLGDRGADAKVIVASGYHRRYAELAARLGDARGLVTGMIRKPFRLAELRAVLA